MEKINIRKAKKIDLENIANIYIKSWKKSFSKFLLLSTLNKLYVQEKTVYFNKLLDQQAQIFLAEDKKTKIIVGYIIFEKSFGVSAEIIAFNIATAYPNLEKELFVYLKKYCIQNNIIKVFLWTFKNNKSGINFYKQIGFYESGMERQSKVEIEQIEIQLIKKI